MCRESLRQSLLVVEQATMIDGPKRFFEMCGAVFSNFPQAVGKCDSAFPTGAFQALPNRLRDCFRHACSRKLGQLVRESVRFLVLDVEAHKGTILPSFSTLLPLQTARRRFSVHIRPYTVLVVARPWRIGCAEWRVLLTWCSSLESFQIDRL